jgi:hypothetical protein
MEQNVALIIFNRPETTRVVFEVVRRAKPQRLFVIADGPRPHVEGEADRCRMAREIVDQGIDWPCDVRRNYSTVNLGCRLRPPSGLDWVFQQVGHCIILEDDCVPHPSFFPYCQSLLERYRDDTRVMLISGDNFQFGRQRTPYSYYFSSLVHIWGWATWSRAWQKYDRDIKLWPEVKRAGWLQDILGDKHQARYWTGRFDAIVAGLNTWDFQWIFSCWMNSGMCILPAVNLVSNIGFHRDATHTTEAGLLANQSVEEMIFPLVHPPYMIRDRAADTFTYERCYRPSGAQGWRFRLAGVPWLRSLRQLLRGKPPVE